MLGQTSPQEQFVKSSQLEGLLTFQSHGQGKIARACDFALLFPGPQTAERIIQTMHNRQTPTDHRHNAVAVAMQVDGSNDALIGLRDTARSVAAWPDPVHLAVAAGTAGMVLIAPDVAALPMQLALTMGLFVMGVRLCSRFMR